MNEEIGISAEVMIDSNNDYQMRLILTQDLSTWIFQPTLLDSTTMAEAQEECIARVYSVARLLKTEEEE